MCRDPIMTRALHVLHTVLPLPTEQDDQEVQKKCKCSIGIPNANASLKFPVCLIIKGIIPVFIQ